MSERQQEEQQQPALSADGGEGAARAAPTTAGAWLREARQQRGLHIAALAALLKVPQAKLEALEADRWQDLTDMTFVRALAKAVCRTLKVDPEPVLALLPRTGEPELNVSKGINKPFRERAARDEGVSLALLQRPLVWGPALLLLAAAAVYLLPNRLLEHAPDAAAPAASEPVLAAAPASEAVVVETVSSAPPQAVAVAGAVPASAPPRLAAASAPAAVPVPPPAAASAAAPVGDALPLRLQLSADSWISVTDARGQVLLSRLVRPGDELALVGQAPLKVTVGNVAGTALSWRGTPFDLAARNVNNVARFELN